MKKLYISSWLMMLSIALFGQQRQNNNWVFGDFNLTTFNPSVVGQIPSALNYVRLEGCASVSDRLGNLLMFTDGLTLWHHTDQFPSNNYTVVPGTLMGTPSSAQNSVFVPVPNHQDQYYIFTLSGHTRVGSDPKIPYMQGLHYSIVDLDAGTCGPAFTALNIPLQDHLSTNIDPAYGNWSEAITTFINPNTNEYWLIVHIEAGETGGFMYAYKVTETGVGIGGAPNSFVARNVSHPAGNINPNSFCAKVAQVENGTPNLHNMAMTCGSGGLYYGSFDDLTGTMVMNNRVEYSAGGNPPYVYGLEFSPDGNVMYYSRIASGTNVVKTSFPPAAINNVVTPVSAARGLQLGPDFNIYVSQSNTPTLTEITNPNTLTGPLATTVVPLLFDAKNCVPQWVWKQTCEEWLIDNEDVPANFQTVEEQRRLTITSTSRVNNNARLIYHAGDFIELLPDTGCPGDIGFESVFGSQFVAEITNCGVPFTYKASIAAANSNDGISYKESGIKIYPNPSSDRITIAYESNLKSIVVSAIEGKTVLRLTATADHVEIDVSNLREGVYLVAVETADGKILNSKFIKN